MPILSFQDIVHLPAISRKSQEIKSMNVSALTKIWNTSTFTRAYKNIIYEFFLPLLWHVLMHTEISVLLDIQAWEDFFENTGYMFFPEASFNWT